MLLALLGVGTAGVLLGCLRYEIDIYLTNARLKRDECKRYGHVWGPQFTGMGVWCRNCTRCKLQEHSDEGWE